MIIKIKKSTYKGFSDGTSLTNERCKQILAIYQHVQSLGKKLMNYKELQKEVAKEKLFGGQTIGESAIRTIFPLLAKTGLVDYDGQFYACDLFTKTGAAFAETYSALLLNEDLSNQNLQNELEHCLSLIQRYGLFVMNEQEAYSHHGFWLVCSILKEEREIYWTELLYILFLVKEKNISLKTALSMAKDNRKKSLSYEYYNENDEQVANTTFSYLHAYLLEASLIKDRDQKSSILQDSMLPFIKELKL